MIDYLCRLKEGDKFETVDGELRNMFESFKAMRTTKSHLLYFDYCGNVLDAGGKTGGQQGDPLEIIVFCLSVHHLWDRTLNQHQQDACAVAYADDGCIMAELGVPSGSLGHQARAQGGRWLRPQFQQDKDPRQECLGG